jgi:IkappaB kinase complex, IKAP component
MNHFRRSSRSKRKLERKVGSGRKGTVDEEEYLLKSVTKLVGRFTTTQGETFYFRLGYILGGDWQPLPSQGEARSLLPHLSQFTPEHRAAARLLQDDLRQFELELKEALEEIWPKPIENEDTWASRMEEREKGRQTDAVDKVPKPDLSRAVDWQMRLLDLEEGNPIVWTWTLWDWILVDIDKTSIQFNFSVDDSGQSFLYGKLEALRILFLS